MHSIDLSKYFLRTDLIKEQIKADNTYQIKEEIIDNIKLETINIDKTKALELSLKEGVYKNIYFSDATDEVNANNLLKVLTKTLKDLFKELKLDTKDNVLKLSLNNYLTVDNEPLEYIYSNNDYYHNDTIYGSLAYYLNNTYLNNLSYKNNILSNTWSNGIYGTSNNYNYKETLSTKIDTKVTVLSIGNVILNGELSDYYLSTGVSQSNSLVYTVKNNGTLYGKSSTSTSKIVPTISIDKNILTKGKGTIDSPYEME